ncbi:F-box protein-like protein [Dinothrombium tinctorium]|uniref:F-box protein-like protein n=1 Tax=Dinothrombium tinctorium TaxID=1965070 RepID=A0A3S3QUL2_9ACAR|nr:F-box protein-like protein [Dinothrombium tinctorium]
METKASKKTTEISDLPDVVLEYILSHLSIYSDLSTCRLVSKTWYRCVNSAIAKNRREFKNSIRNCSVEWLDYSTTQGPNISGRYSHSCCLYRNVMYIFGGCTIANTTFNDLWTFDLSERQWIRPLVTGSYPPPKACASLVRYKESLILFGGWTHSSPYPLHQDWKLFNQIHKFDIKTNRWSAVTSKSECPSIAGHYASVINNEMIVFGGLVSEVNMQNSFIPSNDIWVFNFDKNIWRKQSVISAKPSPRYGHSQIVLDDYNLLIFGGCGGPNMLFNDVWLLTFSDFGWCWKEMEVKHSDSSGLPIIGFHPGCKVEDLVVFLNKGQMCKTFESTKESPIIRKAIERIHFSPNATRQANNRLQPQPSKQERKQQLLGCSSKPSIRLNPRLDRQKQLHFLDKMEQRLKELKAFSAITLPTVKKHSQYSKESMSLFVLDISKVLSEGYVQWLPRGLQTKGPQEKILYSLIAGESELIMFGGIQKNKSGLTETNSDSQTCDIVSNTVHVASFKRSII